MVPMGRPPASRGLYSEVLPLEREIKLPEGAERVGVTGPAERNLKIIRESLGVRLTERGARVRITGERGAVLQAARLMEQLIDAARNHRPMSRQQLLEAVAEPVSEAALGGEGEPVAPNEPVFDVYLAGKQVRPQTPGQHAYLDALRGHDLTFCVGPAGTGKTYMAVAAAVSLLRRGAIRKLVLVRPAVEAGEKLGFLPGTMQDKVNPYLRPLLDALHDMMEFEQIERLMAVDLIEIVPLAFMRGRTLNDSMIILDEAQNTTRAQMLMFLTRLGHGSKMIVTGDTSQIDLDDPRDSGLVDAVHRLRNVRGVARVALTGRDIVRHDLVQRIVEVYEQTDPRRQRVDADVASDEGE